MLNLELNMQYIEKQSGPGAPTITQPMLSTQPDQDSEQHIYHHNVHIYDNY